MAQKSKPEIILEFVKIFIWPTLAMIAVLWLGPDLKEILKSRTWKIGIIEVGDRVSNLEETLKEELLVQQEYLDKILKNPADADQVKGYATQAMEAIQNAQEGVRKEIRNIRETLPEQQLPAEPAKEALIIRDDPGDPHHGEGLGTPWLRISYRQERSGSHRSLLRGPENLARLPQCFRNQVVASAKAG